jgi:acyl-CoA synthetase (AMP-forming)/AMP-acid ligase II
MDAAAEQIGDREAYVDGPHRVTFAEWIGMADALASKFAELGVGRGDIIALHLGQSVHYAIAYAAAARLGAIATGINLRLGPRETGAILARCRARLLLIEDAASSPPGIGATPVMCRHEMAEAASKVGARPPQSTATSDDPVSIIWTSGTTGTPKGAWFDHRNLAAAVPAAGAMTRAFDRRISPVPMAHAGYMAKLWEQLAMGVTIVIAPTPWTAESMLELLPREQINVGAGVPTQWAKLLELPGLTDADFSHLRIALTATAPAAPELVERVGAALGCPLVVRYAMTESPSITGTEPDDPADVQYRTVGRPQAGMRVAIVDGDGHPVPQGHVGRVQVRGGCVMRGYWNDAAATAEVLSPDGTLTSSDLGRFDPDGNLVLLGRAVDLYIRGGYNVYPLEVEQVIAEHPSVAEVAVVGVPTEVIGEIGVAVVVSCEPSSPPTLAELRSWVAARLADYKAPDRLVVTDALPFTAMGKVDKRILLEAVRS